jgi:hypothetical protein
MRVRSTVGLKVLYGGLALLVIAIPAAVTFLMLDQYIGVSLDQFMPWVNDEASLWHQALTFSHHGFTGGGYYTLYELPAKASFTHYYAWGPFYPMLQGIFARIFGWELYSGVIFNIMLLTGAIAFFVYAARPTLVQLLLMGVLLATFWTMLVYIPTGMQESFQSAAAIVLAAMFYRLIKEGPALPRAWQWALGITILCVSLIRGTWVLAFFPYFLLLSEHSWRGYLYAFVKALVLSAAAFAFYSYISSELPYRFTDQLFDAVAAASGLGDKINAALDMFGDRLELNRRLYQEDMPSFDWLLIGVVMWLEYFVLLIGVAIWLGVRATRAYRARQPFRLGESIPREILFHGLNLLLLLILLVLLYQVDFRMGVAALLLSLLVMLMSRHYWVVVTVILVNLLVTPYFSNTYKVYVQGRFFPYRPYVEQVDALVNPYVEFDDDAPTGWCNTLLIPVEIYSWPVTVVPEGIGVSMYYTLDDLPLPAKSKYLVLTDSGAQRIGETQSLEKLSTQAMGLFTEPIGLYVNHDAGCEGRAAAVSG